MDTKKIVAGPNKDMLFDACKYAYSKSAKIKIEFALMDEHDAPIVMSDTMITGIEHEDGSGDSFNIFGYCKLNSEPLSAFIFAYYRFTAYYNVRTRKGTISFSR